jgi:hypothetical protein
MLVIFSNGVSLGSAKRKIGFGLSIGCSGFKKDSWISLSEIDIYSLLNVILLLLFKEGWLSIFQ